MDSKKAIEYITSRDWHESRLGLERMEELLDRLGNPHKELRYVHVAGTNGKGSICAMLASVLTSAGYKTGMYTSPYINCFNERIQVDGQPIDDQALVALTERVQVEADRMLDHPTEFELVTAIAFAYFHLAGCDIVVLEVGLGGRLDATNVIPVPEVAVITPISLDHVAELGDTAEKIAAEKGGIIKPGGSVVSSPQVQGAADVLRAICMERNASIKFLDAESVKITQNAVEGIRFGYKGHEDLELHLLGSYQAQNAAVVIMTVEQLQSKGWNIGEAAMRNGLAETRWPARFEIVHKHPWVIVDGGHNPQCMDSLVESLNTYFPDQKITFIAGVMADKDYNTMFRKIPYAKRIFTVTPDSPRALSAGALAAYFYAQGIQAQDVKACENVEQAVKEALKIETEKGVICAAGSFYMAGAIRKLFVSV